MRLAHFRYHCRAVAYARHRQDQTRLHRGTINRPGKLARILQTTDHAPTDRGSAVAEFVMVSALLAVVFGAVLQLCFALHVRNTVTDSALAGARAAAMAGGTEAEARELTARLISSSIGPRYAEHIAVTSRPAGELDIVTVSVTTPIPLIGPVGPPGVWELEAHTIAEDLEGIRE